MQPLIVSQQITQGIADFLRAAFPAATPGFDGLIQRFLADRDRVFKGPYLTLPLPFRKQPDRGQPAFGWLTPGFVPHAHQGQAFIRLTGEQARLTLVATGTGSGKTECFLYPILGSVVTRHEPRWQYSESGPQPGTKRHSWHSGWQCRASA